MLGGQLEPNTNLFPGHLYHLKYEARSMKGAKREAIVSAQFVHRVKWKEC